MNKANLKSYAPKARLDFIKAVTERANVLGISAAGAVPAEVRGDVALIDGREWPAKVAGQRDELIARIKRHGFEQTMDEVAYTWFNRFAALRYMEIHDYLGHGWRVLSSRDGGLPEILRHASEVTLPGLNAGRAREMQLAGNQDNELYKLLLVAQCNDLSRVMPFLFERIDDETELLLPENLLRTDSIVAKLVEQVPEEDWQEIEVIGWLYQFYISEKKDQVIGKVVKSEDIPAATQLFTPNWIVQYLVQNSVGRLWLMANPTSMLASQWPYYIHPAEQTPEVQAQLDALIQTRIREDGETLNPETITVLDPACGSGHILVVAYDVLKAIYLERGYQPRAIPRLILEKNLYGLDIDDRAAQLAAFALLMKARADDRRLFSDPPKLNLLALQESKGLDADELAIHLAPFGLQRASLKGLVDAFNDAKTFGSLIQIPPNLTSLLATMDRGLQRAAQHGDLYSRQAAKDVLPLVQQAALLSTQFDSVVANPPYLGLKGMNTEVKGFAKREFNRSKSDLFAIFMERGLALCKPTGHMSMVTMQGWMFLSSFEEMRKWIISNRAISSLIQIGFNSFPEMNSKIAQACAFSIAGVALREFVGEYINLNDADQSADKNDVFLRRSARNCHLAEQSRFSRIPGSPIAYWLSEKMLRIFDSGKPLGTMWEPKKGLLTSDDARFIRYWHEVAFPTIFTAAEDGNEFDCSDKRWAPLNKGGTARKWYGNKDLVMKWEGNGREMKEWESYIQEHANAGGRVINENCYFKPGVTWTEITTNSTTFRYMPPGMIFTAKGPAFFPSSKPDLLFSLGFLGSNLARRLIDALNPTITLNPSDVARIPLPNLEKETVSHNTSRLVDIAKSDWDGLERSWDYVGSRLARLGGGSLLSESWSDFSRHCYDLIATTLKLEKENNGFFISALGLDDEFSADPSEDQTAMWCADREKDCQNLVSYIIGCVMGRYSLDAPGLIYAEAGNIGFDTKRYEKRFPVDADGILPLSGEHWFEDDAASRVREFLCAVWGDDKLEENSAWLAHSLGTKGIETPDETIRRYLADKFFKDHL